MASIRTLQWVDAAVPTLTFAATFAAPKQPTQASHALVTPFGTRPVYTGNAPSSAPPPG